MYIPVATIRLAILVVSNIATAAIALRIKGNK